MQNFYSQSLQEYSFQNPLHNNESSLRQIEGFYYQIL